MSNHQAIIDRAWEILETLNFKCPQDGWVSEVSELPRGVYVCRLIFHDAGGRTPRILSLALKDGDLVGVHMMSMSHHVANLVVDTAWVGGPRCVDGELFWPRARTSRFDDSVRLAARYGLDKPSVDRWWMNAGFTYHEWLTVLRKTRTFVPYDLTRSGFPEHLHVWWMP